MGVKDGVKNKLRQQILKLESETAALYCAFKRKDTPKAAKIVIGVAVCYALSPIDLIPDFIPVIGFLDDLLLLPILVTVAVKFIPARVLDECRQEARNTWPDGKPKSLLCSLPIVVIWLTVSALIMKTVWQ
jgi:uncharacterized membrane protein YkvA (DUF1232 family)